MMITDTFIEFIKESLYPLFQSMLFDICFINGDSIH